MANKESNIKQWLIPVLKLSVALGLIWWLVDSGKFDLQSMAKINRPEVWFVGMTLFVGTLLFNTKRWQMLLRLENIDITYRETFALSIIGIFFNFVIPGGVGGDVVKGGYLMQSYKNKKMFIGWSLFVDRAFGMLALMIFSGLAGLLFYNQLEGEIKFSIYSLSILILLGIGSFFAFVIFSPKQKMEDLLFRHPMVEKIFYPLYFFFKKPKAIALPMALSFLSQSCTISIPFILSIFLGVDIPWWAFAILVPFGMLAIIVPIAPAGLGVGQMAFYYLFEKVVQEGEFAVLAITFLQVSQFIIGLLGGVVFVLYKKGEKSG